MADRFLQALQQHGLKDVSIAAEGAKVIGYLDTGNYALNWSISNRFLGGWPLGHVTEIYGDPSTGKSYLVARAIAQALQRGGVALLDDTEGAFNAVWASTKLGVATDRLAYRKSDTVAEHMDTVKAYVAALKDVLKGWKKEYGMEHKEALGPSVLALDSLALLSTEHEQKVGLEKVSLTRAKEVRTMLRIMGSQISELPVAYLIANHTIANIGDPFHPKDTPGGGGVKFQASIRLELQRVSKVKVETQIVGVKVKCKVEKNRFAVPWRTTEMVIPFFEAISPYSGLIPLLTTLGVLIVPVRTLVLRDTAGVETETRIPAHKSDFLKQDGSAQELLTMYPDLLKNLDAYGKLGESATPISEGHEVSEE